MKKTILVTIAVWACAIVFALWHDSRLHAQQSPGVATIFPSAANNSSSFMVVDVISDEHQENAGNNIEGDLPLNLPHVSPADMVNRVRADNPNYLIVNGDLGHNSMPVEYNAIFIQSATAVTTVGSNTISVNTSSSYVDGGVFTPNTNLQGTINSSADYASLPLIVNAWVAIYDCVGSTSCATPAAYPGANFEMVQITAVNLASNPNTFTAVFAHTHPAGFLMRAHAMNEYWDWMLQGRVIMSGGNHDVGCSVADGALYTYAQGTGGSCGSSHGPESILTFLRFGFPNGGAFPYTGAAGVSYYSTVVNSLLGVIAIDSTGWSGQAGAYGTIQETTLRCALSGGTGAGCFGSGALPAKWIVTTQHYPPSGSICQNGGNTPWALNYAVDVAFFGHIHDAEYFTSQRCLGAACTTGVGLNGSATIPYIDTSSYTALGFQGLETCNPPDSPLPSTLTPPAVRNVLNGYNLDDAGGIGTRFRSYVKMVLTPHTLTWSMINNSGGVVCDYINTSVCAQGVLVK